MYAQNREQAEIMAYRENIARNALTALGETVEQVVGKLTELGITGVRRSAGACPIAVYLNQQYPDDHVRAIVGASRWTIDDTDDFQMPGISGELPYAVQRFIEMFDQGDLPAFIKLTC